MCLLRRIDRHHLHHNGDRHAYEANEDAGDPLRERERGRVREVAEELDYDELEDDGAAEDGGEHVVVQYALEDIYPLHLP